MPSWCRQVNWGNCGIPWVSCAVYSAFSSGMKSHNNITQFNWECVGRYTLCGTCSYHRTSNSKLVFNKAVVVCVEAVFVKSAILLMSHTWNQTRISESLLLILLYIWVGTAVAQWLRCCATNRKVAGSISACVIGIFHWHKIKFRSHYGPGVDSVSNRNEYQQYFLGVKAAGA